MVPHPVVFVSAEVAFVPLPAGFGGARGGDGRGGVAVEVLPDLPVGCVLSGLFFQLEVGGQHLAAAAVGFWEALKAFKQSIIRRLRHEDDDVDVVEGEPLEGGVPLDLVVLPQEGKPFLTLCLSAFEKTHLAGHDWICRLELLVEVVDHGARLGARFDVLRVVPEDRRVVIN